VSWSLWTITKVHRLRAVLVTPTVQFRGSPINSFPKSHLMQIFLVQTSFWRSKQHCIQTTCTCFSFTPALCLSHIYKHKHTSYIHPYFPSLPIPSNISLTPLLQVLTVFKCPCLILWKKDSQIQTVKHPLHPSLHHHSPIISCPKTQMIKTAHLSDLQEMPPNQYQQPLWLQDCNSLQAHLVSVLLTWYSELQKPNEL